MGEKDDCDDLHKEVLKFHRKEYHAEKMKLVIISGGEVILSSLFKFIHASDISGIKFGVSVDIL